MMRRSNNHEQQCGWRVKLLWLFVLLCVTMSPCGSVPPNNICCDKALDSKACLVSDGTPKGCIGGFGFGFGFDCDGIPIEILGKSFNLFPNPPAVNGTFTLSTSVGTILHDACCIDYPQGAFCSLSNLPVKDLFNIFGHADNECACLAEFRKANRDSLRGHTWDATFQVDELPNLTLVPSLVRNSWLPKDYKSNYLPNASNWGIVERAATANICAPPGTPLDCPAGADANCQVPSCDFWEKTCRACSSGCSETERNRWNMGGRDHANGGDSDYCCSDSFSQVYSDWWSGGYGICA